MRSSMTTRYTAPFTPAAGGLSAARRRHRATIERDVLTESLTQRHAGPACPDLTDSISLVCPERAPSCIKTFVPQKAIKHAPSILLPQEISSPEYAVEASGPPSAPSRESAPTRRAGAPWSSRRVPYGKMTARGRYPLKPHIPLLPRLRVESITRGSGQNERVTLSSRVTPP